MKTKNILFFMFIMIMLALTASGVFAAESRFTVKTAAVDRDTRDYINPCNINLGGVEKIGTPNANYEINSNTVYAVTHSADGYETDTDYIFLDENLDSCEGENTGDMCYLTSYSSSDSEFNTVCEFSAEYQSWLCDVTNNGRTESYIYAQEQGAVAYVINTLSPVDQENQPPVVDVEATPLEGEAPLEVTFTIDVTDDESISRVMVFFGDDTSTLAQEQSIVIHTYEKPGIYEAQIVAHDNQGLPTEEIVEITVSEQPGADTFLVKTAAVDRETDEYINPCNINLGGVEKIGTPNANYEVNSNTVYTVTHSASGYETDTDSIYLDSHLILCEGENTGDVCELSSYSSSDIKFDTVCEYSAESQGWLCDVTDTSKDKTQSYIYDPFQEGNVVYVINTLAPVDPENQPPVVNAQVLPLEGDAPLNVGFTIDVTDDESINQVIVFFGDGSSQETDPQDFIIHTYTQPGTYTAEIVAHDNQGLPTIVEYEITVNRVQAYPIIVKAEANPAIGTAPLEVTFSNEVTDDGFFKKVEWDLGDGTKVIVDAVAEFTYTYENDGDYVATLTATDNEDLTVQSDGIFIEVLEWNPQANVYPSVTIHSPQQGDVVIGDLDVNVQMLDPDGTIDEYAIELLDENDDFVNLLSHGHPYEQGVIYFNSFDSTIFADGNYKIKVHAWDNEGAHTSVTSGLFEIDNIAPSENTPPVPKIYEPDEGEVFSGDESIVFEVYDEQGGDIEIALVLEYEPSGEKDTLLQTVVELDPYEVFEFDEVFQTEYYPDGMYTLRLFATDEDYEREDHVLFEIDNFEAEVHVEFIQPQDGDVIDGIYEIQWDAYEYEGAEPVDDEPAKEEDEEIDEDEVEEFLEELADELEDELDDEFGLLLTDDFIEEVAEYVVNIMEEVLYDIDDIDDLEEVLEEFAEEFYDDLEDELGDLLPEETIEDMTNLVMDVIIDTLDDYEDMFDYLGTFNSPSTYATSSGSGSGGSSGGGGSGGSTIDNLKISIFYVNIDKGQWGMLATELDNTGSYIFDTNDLIDGRYIFEIYAESPETLEWDYDSVGLIYIDNYENEPIAHAGYDTAAVVGETVILDGSRSYDVDPYDDLNFYWQQITGPVPSAIMNQYSRFASFVPAAPGTYLFNLCVDDGYYGDCDEVIITVTGEPMPQALKIMKPQEEEKEPLVRDIFVSSVEADDNKVYYEPGERMHLSVSFANELEEDIEQATVQIIAPKLRLLREFGPFELEEEEMVTKEVVFTIPEDAKPGTYEVRVIITTPEDQRVKIRKIKIL